MARTEYDPKRQKTPVDRKDPLEIALVYNVRACGTCNFFWPNDPADQPYGPFPTFDFKSNMPEDPPSGDNDRNFPIFKVNTKEPSFPNGDT